MKPCLRPLFLLSAFRFGAGRQSLRQKHEKAVGLERQSHINPDSVWPGMTTLTTPARWSAEGGLGNAGWELAPCATLRIAHYWVGIFTMIPAMTYKNPIGISVEALWHVIHINRWRQQSGSPLSTWEMESSRVWKVLSFSVKSRIKMRFQDHCQLDGRQAWDSYQTT